MPGPIIRAPENALSTELAAVVAAAGGFLLAARSENTIRAQNSDWRMFDAWCARVDRDSMPAAPETVGLYLSALAKGLADPDDPRPRKASTVARHLATISVRHRRAGFPSPKKFEIVTKTMDGINRSLGRNPAHKDPAESHHLRAMVMSLPDTLLGLRNRVLLLVGFSGAFRRSELVGICFEHVEWVDQGIVVFLPRSKTDQTAKGRHVRIPRGVGVTCPVAALRAWCEEMKDAGITTGPVLRSVRAGHAYEPLTDQTVARVVKGTVAALGMDPRNFAGHSLRSGHVTSAAKAGHMLKGIQDKTGHKSLDMLAQYIHLVGSWEEDSSNGLL
jgi:site-specific recombinase XerD